MREVYKDKPASSGDRVIIMYTETKVVENWSVHKLHTLTESKEFVQGQTDKQVGEQSSVE